MAGYKTIRSILFLILLVLSVPARAASEHAALALLAADRQEWSEALNEAQQDNDPTLQSLITWLYALDPDSKADFGEITGFMRAHPDWPDQKKLRVRAEIAIEESSLSAGEVIDWFGGDTPITGAGKIALAQALMDSSNPPADKITSLIRDGWRDGDFNEPTERRILASHGGILRASDHEARIDRLLFEDKTGAAKRLLPQVSTARQGLYKARLALIDNKKTAALAVNQVDGKLKHDPGLIFDRMRYRAKRDDDKGVREMLLLAPKDAPFPDKWWRYRDPQIRSAIGERNYKMAEKLLANRGNLTGQPHADALWLEGWLDLQFHEKSQSAYDVFYRMYNEVKYPVSRARAAYWAARAAEKGGDTSGANGWYDTASAFPTTFYGQLASLKRNGTAPLHLPADPGSGNEGRFENSDLARAIKICAENDEPDLASRLISSIAENAENDGDAIGAASFGAYNGLPYLSVRGAKKALQRNIVMVKVGYPHPPTPELAVERPLALAITRQESEFLPTAKSPSGALGMMQLLPSTAKETARKAGIDYDKSRLYDIEYNMTLGSLYLSRMIDSYSGSYVMAIAAYNGGPGNVRNWASTFGTPGGSIDNVVDWIEKIPFSETRNYVQRVMENLQVYRHIESGGDKLLLGEDLVR